MRTDKPFEKFLSIMRAREAERFVPEGGVVVDFGCGYDALFLRRIAGRVRKGVGIDRDVPKGEGNLSFIRAGLGPGLPVKGGSADMVVMLAVVEHLDDPLAVLGEARRILRRGGLIAMTFPSGRAEPLLRIFAKLGALEPENIGEHKSHFKSGGVPGMLRKAGFSGVRRKPFQLGLNNLAVARKK